MNYRVTSVLHVTVQVSLLGEDKRIYACCHRNRSGELNKTTEKAPMVIAQRHLLAPF